MSRILTVNNTTYSMNNIMNETKELMFCVLDYSDPTDVDYKFNSLLFLESFNKSAVDVQIGPHRVLLPSDWSIVIADKNSGEVELLNLKQLNDREFTTFSINPINGYIPDFLNIEIMNVFPDMQWFFPKLEPGHILVFPLEEKDKSSCIFVTKETNKLPEVLDISQMV